MNQRRSPLSGLRSPLTLETPPVWLGLWPQGSRDRTRMGTSPPAKGALVKSVCEPLVPLCSLKEGGGEV